MDNKENIHEGNSLGKRQNNLSVPSDYFDHLPEQIMNRIQASEQKKQFFLLRPAFTIPSFTVLAGVILFLVLINKNNISSNDMLLSDNDTQHIIDNPELYNIDDAVITEQYLASNISDESIDEEAAASADEIKSYMEENPDLNNIINEQ